MKIQLNTVCFILLFSCIYLQSCSNSSHDNCPPIYESMRANDIAVVPYTPNSQLVFYDTYLKETISFACCAFDTGRTLDHNFRDDCYLRYYMPSRTWKFVSPKHSDTLIVRQELDLNYWRFYVIFGNQEFAFRFERGLLLGNETLHQNGSDYTHVYCFQHEMDASKLTKHYCYSNYDYGIIKLERDSGNLELLKLVK